MVGSGKERLPCEITRAGWLAVGTAFIISLCLFWYAAEDPYVMAMTIGEPVCSTLLAVFPGGSLMGAALGAVIGRAFRDEKGGAALMGGFVGVLAGPLVVVILLMEFMTVIDMWVGITRLIR